MKRDCQGAPKAMAIKLNVGGRKFETTGDTLSSVRVSFFEPLLEGRIPYATDEDGYIFIDRDGNMFELILQWLRCMQRPEEQILKKHYSALLEE